MTIIPMVIETTGRGVERAFDIQSRLLRDRIVMLHDEVNDHTSGLIVSQLLYLEAENPDAPIYLYINSGGGSITSGMQVYDICNMIKPKVISVVSGIAASMGSFLAMSCDERWILPSARTMIHQPSSGHHRATVSDLEISLNESKNWKKHLTELYVKHNSANTTYEQFEKMMDRDTWLSAKEAVDLGLADKIIYKRET